MSTVKVKQTRAQLIRSLRQRLARLDKSIFAELVLVLKARADGFTCDGAPALCAMPLVEWADSTTGCTLEELDHQLELITSGKSSGRIGDGPDLVDERPPRPYPHNVLVVDYYAQRQAVKEVLDRFLAGSQRYFSLVGPSGSGKSQFLMSQALEAYQQGRHTAYLNMELCAHGDIAKVACVLFQELKDLLTRSTRVTVRNLVTRIESLSEKREVTESQSVRESRSVEEVTIVKDSLSPFDPVETQRRAGSESIEKLIADVGQRAQPESYQANHSGIYVPRPQELELPLLLRSHESVTIRRDSATRERAPGQVRKLGRLAEEILGLTADVAQLLAESIPDETLLCFDTMEFISRNSSNLEFLAQKFLKSVEARGVKVVFAGQDPLANLLNGQSIACADDQELPEDMEVHEAESAFQALEMKDRAIIDVASQHVRFPLFIGLVADLLRKGIITEVDLKEWGKDLVSKPLVKRFDAEPMARLISRVQSDILKDVYEHACILRVISLDALEAILQRRVSQADFDGLERGSLISVVGGQPDAVVLHAHLRYILHARLRHLSYPTYLRLHGLAHEHFAARLEDSRDLPDVDRNALRLEVLYHLYACDPDAWRLELHRQYAENFVAGDHRFCETLVAVIDEEILFADTSRRYRGELEKLRDAARSLDEGEQELRTRAAGLEILVRCDPAQGEMKPFIFAEISRKLSTLMYRLDNIPAAEARLAQAREIDPDSREQFVAEIEHLQTRSTAAVREFFEQQARRHADPADFFYELLAHFAVEYAQWSWGEQFLKDALDQAPARVPILRATGSLLAARGRKRAAVDHLEQALSLLDDSEAVITLDLARLYRQLGDEQAEKAKWQQAIDLLDSSTDYGPEQAARLETVGDIFEEAWDDYPNAVLSYERAIAMDPGKYAVHEKLFLLLLKRGDLEQAGQAVKQAEGQSRPAWKFDLRKLNNRLQLHDKGLSAVCEQLEDDLPHAEVVDHLIALGLAEEADQSWQHAHDIFARLGQMDHRQRAASWEKVGDICFARLSDYQRALEAYEQSLAVDPAHLRSLFGSIRAGVAAGDWRRVEQAHLALRARARSKDEKLVEHHADVYLLAVHGETSSALEAIQQQQNAANVYWTAQAVAWYLDEDGAYQASQELRAAARKVSAEADPDGKVGLHERLTAAFKTGNSASLHQAEKLLARMREVYSGTELENVAAWQAELMVRRNDLDGAVQYLEQFIGRHRLVSGLTQLVLSLEEGKAYRAAAEVCLRLGELKHGGQAAALERAGDLLRDKCANPGAALEAYQRCLAVDGSRLSAMRELFSTALRQRHWPLAEQASQGIAAHTEQHPTRGPARARAAAVIATLPCIRGEFAEALAELGRLSTAGEKLSALEWISSYTSVAEAQARFLLFSTMFHNELTVSEGDDPTVQLLRVAELLKADDLDQAEALLDDSSETSNDREASALLRAELLARRGETPEAVDVLQQSLGGYVLVNALIKVVKRLEGGNSFATAVEVYKVLGELEHSQRGAAWEKAGDLLRDRLEQPEASIAAYERCIELEPARQSAVIELLVTTARSRGMPDAEARREQLLASAGGDSQKKAVVLAGATFLCREGQVEEALEMVKAEIPGAEVMSSLNSIALTVMRAGDTTLGLSILKAAQESSPTEHDDLPHQFRQALKERNLDQTGALLQQIIDSGAFDEQQVLAARALYLCGQQDVEGAIRLLSESLDYQARVPGLFALAMALEQVEAVEPAVAVYRHLGELPHAQRASAWEKAGDLLRDRLRRPKEAWDAYEQSLAYEPARSSVFVEMLRISMRQQSWDQAEQVCAKLDQVALAEDLKIKVRLARAAMYCVRGMIQDAVSQLGPPSEEQQFLKMMREVAKFVGGEGALSNVQAFLNEARRVFSDGTGLLSLLLKFHEAFKEKETDRAVELLKQIERRPDSANSPEAGMARAMLIAAQQGVDAALAMTQESTSGEDTISALIALALGLQEGDAVEQAVEVYLHLGGLDHAGRAEVLERAGDLLRDSLDDQQRARQAYEKSLQVEPSRKTALLELMTLSLQQQDWPAAEEVCDRIEAAATEEQAEFEGKLARATVLCVQGQVSAAREMVQQAAGDRDFFKALLAVAQRVVKADAPSAAQELITMTPGDDPSQLQVLPLKNALRSGDLLEAERLLEQLEQGPATDIGRKQLVYFRALLLALKLDVDAAMDLLDQSLPPLEAAAGRVGLVSSLEEINPQAAIAFHQRLAELDMGQRAPALERVGDLYRDKLGQLEQAWGAYEQSLAADPTHTAAVIGMVKAALKFRDRKRAEAAWQRYSELAATDQQQSQLNLLRAAILCVHGEVSQAFAVIQQSVEIHEALDWVRAVARFVESVDSPEYARALLDTAVQELEEQDPVARATTLAEQGDYQGAMDLLLELPDFARQIHSLIGLAGHLEQHKRFDGAVAVYGKLGAMEHGQQAAALQRVGDLCRDNLLILDVACEHYEKSLEVEPTRVPALVELVRTHLLADDLEAAEAACSRLEQFAAEANIAEAQLTRQALCCVQGQLEQTLAQLWELDGGVTFLPRARGLAHFLELAGRRDLARELDQASRALCLARAPDSPHARPILIEQATKESDFDQAKSLITSAKELRLPPAMQQDIDFLEFAMVAVQNTVADAVQLIEERTTHQQQLFSVLHTLAPYLERQGRADLVLDVFLRMLDGDHPQRELVLARVVQEMMLQEREEEALEYANQAGLPKHCCGALAWGYQVAQRPRQAAIWWERAIEGGEPTANDMLGYLRVLVTLERWDTIEAQGLLEQTEQVLDQQQHEGGPDQRRYRLWLSMLLGRITEAMQGCLPILNITSAANESGYHRLLELLIVSSWLADQQDTLELALGRWRRDVVRAQMSAGMLADFAGAMARRHGVDKDATQLRALLDELPR